MVTAVTVLAAGLLSLLPGAAPSAEAASCQDGSRESAREIADTGEFFVPVPEAVSSASSSGSPDAIITLRYSESHQCAWGLISGATGYEVWLDRSTDGGASISEGRLGKRSIKNGNENTYTAAFRAGGATPYSLRACGQSISETTAELAQLPRPVPVRPGSGHRVNRPGADDIEDLLPPQPIELEGEIACTAWQRPAVALSDLPNEVTATVELIGSGGPFPYDQDGKNFKNREGRLPGGKPDDYYREYTVDTPGATDRAERRVVTGAGGEHYYTDDHYETFRVVDLSR